MRPYTCIILLAVAQFLLILKLFGLLNWPYAWVLFPLWAPILFWGCVFVWVLVFSFVLKLEL